jgi:pyruvate,orthophosphate dikinase
MADAHVHDLGDLDPSDTTLLGDRGADLARMHRLGLPVSPAFVVDAEACRVYRHQGGALPDGLADAVRAGVARLESLTGKAFAAAHGRPLLLSVRSGISMPGTMDTVDTHDHLLAAIRAVFASWDSRRATAYRRQHDIPDDPGTAVVVQAMVIDSGGSSGSGVAHTRDPKTGNNVLCGEFPADSRPDWAATIAELEAHGRRLEREYTDALDIEFTVEDDAVYLLGVRAAKRTAAAAVRIALDLVDEGLIDPATALRRLTAEHVRALLTPVFTADGLAAAEAAGALLTGIGAAPGHAVGIAVLDADRAAARAGAGEDVILVRPTTGPQDLPGMLVSRAVVTARGGATSHAAVVCRSVHKPCVCGCTGLEVDPGAGVFGVDGAKYDEGTWLSVDGATGRVYAGQLPLGVPEASLTDLARFAAWSEQHPVSEELGAALREAGAAG